MIITRTMTMTTTAVITILPSGIVITATAKITMMRIMMVRLTVLLIILNIESDDDP